MYMCQHGDMKTSFSWDNISFIQDIWWKGIPDIPEICLIFPSTLLWRMFLSVEGHTPYERVSSQEAESDLPTTLSFHSGDPAEPAWTHVFRTRAVYKLWLPTPCKAIKKPKDQICVAICRTLIPSNNPAVTKRIRKQVKIRGKAMSDRQCLPGRSRVRWNSSSYHKP